ncbi:ABC transporter ATP-binding protein [Mycolicibacterium goodii]|uniref:ABC transporter ATP-binding protein n=1 Tax=Mycolicibacterium goodii TaxID=134601 RepID=UPI000AEBDF8C
MPGTLSRSRTHRGRGTGTSTTNGGVQVNIQNLTVTFKGKVAVDNLSLAITPGEMLVLLGPSGCGKTTTMRSLVGLQQPDAGTITIGDRVVFDSRSGVDLPVNARNVGMVFQSYAIWPHMTVAQNIAFPLRMQKRPKSEIADRVSVALDTVGLSGLGDRGASMLSGGQMQRVALARSFVMEPVMLLLDEPLSNLDAKLREKLRFELRELQQRLQMTAVYVTHDQTEALALADRIAIMQDGVIRQLGSPAELYTRPNSTFVADFLGVDNIFPASVVSSRASAGCVVRLDSCDTPIEATDQPGEQERTNLCIRPEDICLSAAPSYDAVNSLPATVDSLSYLGDRIRYHVSVGPELRFTVTRPVDEPALAPGDDATITLPADKVQLLGR